MIGYKSDSWLTENCKYCDSINHIFLSREVPIWECWNCLQIQWLSYDYNHKIFEPNKDIIQVLHGQMERNEL